MIEGALNAFEPDLKAQQDATSGQVVSMPFGAPVAAASQYTKQNPFAAELSLVQKLLVVIQPKMYAMLKFH